MATIESEPANVNQHVCILRPRRYEITEEYLALQMLTSPMQRQIFSNENGVSRDAMNFEQIGNLVLLKPPPGEQGRITTHTIELIDRNGSVEQKMHQAIDKLKEFRSALISAAVTGKIDVREEVS